ncbi:MAG: extracellular solute-binding protein [Clostridia bacterium]
MMKRFCTGLILAAMVLGLAACAPAPEKGPTDILTQKVSDPQRTPITVMVKNAFSINTFEKAAEIALPEIDIVQVGNYSWDRGIVEYEARLKNGDLTDVVMTWPLEVGEAYWADNLLELSALPLTGKYTTAMLESIARDGKLYYLPGPAQVRGIVYNKTLFAEKGWQVPTDFDGFVALCRTIEQSGMRSLQLGLGNAEVLDTAFVGYGYADCFSTPEDRRWLSGYDAGEGSFGDQFAPALQTFQTLIDQDILRKEDLLVHYQDRERMLFTRKCAMIEDSVLLARMGFDRTGCTDEFALMPFFNPGADGDWARLYPVCYIGVDKRLADGKHQEKYDLVMRLLEYISTPEGQLALAGDTGAMYSSLNGVAPPDIPEIADLVPALTHGRYAVFPTLKNAQNALREGLQGMVSGTLTAEDVVRMVDAENRSPSVEAPPEVLGSVSEDFTMLEMGNFITDAMRARGGCEVALFMDNGKDGRTSGKGVNGRWYKGEVTTQDVMRVMPDLRAGEAGELWKVTMRGSDLIKTLEYAVPVDNDLRGWFYYFSGIRVAYAPAAEPGKRVRTITDDKGGALDPKKLYSVAVMDGSIPSEYMNTCSKTGQRIATILENAIREKKIISPSNDGRFTIVDAQAES